MIHTELEHHPQPDPDIEAAGNKYFGIWLKPDTSDRWSNYRLYHTWAKDVARFFYSTQSVVVWDAGSGPGTRFKRLLEYADTDYAFSIIATDLQNEALERFPREMYSTRGKKDTIFTIQADITQPPPFSLPVHGISCLSVLPWVDIEGSKRALSHFYSQLTEGGVLILELCTYLNQVALFADGVPVDDAELEQRAKKMQAHFMNTNNNEPLTVFNHKYKKNVVVHTEKCAEKLLEQAGFRDIQCTHQVNNYFPNGLSSSFDERARPNQSWKARQAGNNFENILLLAKK